MPTVNANFGTQFPAHSINTSIACTGVLKKILGRDTTYGPNLFAQGIPLTVDYDTDAINLILTLDCYERNDWDIGKQYYITISTTKYETVTGGTCYYDTVKGLTQIGTFATTKKGSYNNYGTRTETCTITYTFKANTQYYIYIHFGSQNVTSLYYLVGISGTYEQKGLVWIYTGVSTNSGWQQAIPYIYTSSGWQQAMPYVYKNSTDGWIIGS